MTVTWASGTKSNEDKESNKEKNNSEMQRMKTKKNNNNYEANNIKGAIEELGRNVYCYGRRHQAKFL